MNKKGYTIIEMLAVITLLSLLSYLVVTNLGESHAFMNETNEETYYRNIKSAANLYVSNNYELMNKIGTDGELIITINDLIDNGYILSDNLKDTDNQDILIKMDEVGLMEVIYPYNK